MNKYFLLLLITVAVSYSAKAHVELLSPAGGETFSQGQTITISWKEVIPHNTVNWDLFFSIDGGLNWNVLKADIAPGTLSYQWTIPQILTSEAKIRVVQDNVDSDYSDDSDIFNIDGTTGLETDPESVTWSIYPNPIKDFATLSFENQDNISHTLLLFNTLGHTVKRMDGIIGKQVIIEKGDLPGGLYFFQLSSGSEKIAFGRLVIK